MIASPILRHTTCFTIGLAVTLAMQPIWLSHLGAQAPASRPTPLSTNAHKEVGRLGDLQPARRRLAHSRLRAMGAEAEAALKHGLRSDSLEIRLRCAYLLEELRSEIFDHRLQEFLIAASGTDHPHFPGWKQLRDAVGDSAASRAFYAQLIRKHGTSLTWLDSLEATTAGNHSDPVLDADQYLPLSAADLNGGDAMRWGLVVLAASQPHLNQTPVLTSRVRGGLLNPRVCERIEKSPFREVLRGLISHWLKISSEAYVNSTMLKIALIYDCDSVAMALSQKTLRSPHASPANVSTALAVITRLSPSSARVELPLWTEDHRVCHIWQMVAQRRRAVQTQVGDVAISLLLHLSNQDPRVHGFEDLQADPDLIYREFSMGFESQAKRELAHRSALESLQVTGE